MSELRSDERPPPEAAGDADFAGWTPIRLEWYEGRGRLDWCWLGYAPPTEPFFEQTVQIALRGAAGRAGCRRSSIDALARGEMVKPCVMPAGFIFHMSRCGSTLVSRMFASMPQHFVISEAGVIDAVIQAHRRVPGVTEALCSAWLRGLVSALSRSAAGAERRAFIKFDSWHVLDLPLIRRTFPDVPWIFLYRNPLEVMASHARQSQAAMTTEAAARRARVLGAFCQSALRNLDDDAMLVEYRQLPTAVWTTIAGHFGVACSELDIERMGVVQQFDAKNPELRFFGDTDSKLTEVSGVVREAIDSWVTPLYDELESRRMLPTGAARISHGGCLSTYRRTM
jgi:hypothetical protein